MCNCPRTVSNSSVAKTYKMDKNFLHSTKNWEKYFPFSILLLLRHPTSLPSDDSFSSAFLNIYDSCGTDLHSFERALQLREYKNNIQGKIQSFVVCFPLFRLWVPWLHPWPQSRYKNTFPLFAFSLIKAYVNPPLKCYLKRSEASINPLKWTAHSS